MWNCEVMDLLKPFGRSMTYSSLKSLGKLSLSKFCSVCGCDVEH